MDHEKEWFYAIALRMCKGLGVFSSRQLLARVNSFSAIFELNLNTLIHEFQLCKHKAEAIRNFKDWKNVEQEMKSTKAHDTSFILLTQPEFPKRLAFNDDAPLLLYYKGVPNFNVNRALSIVGTRNCSQYGITTTQNLVKDLAQDETVIISGLAFGIDIVAHKECIKQNVVNWAVLAHGLEQIYPTEHTLYARQILEQGGMLISEYPINTKMHSAYFPERNRIIAGLCDALVVVESDIKGGSMISAHLASDYNKDIFAIPGRAIDIKSKGCNHLIKINKANLATCASDIIYHMRWDLNKTKSEPIQQNLFVELNDTEKQIVELLKQETDIHTDQISSLCVLTPSQTNSILMQMELKGVIISLPGKMYRLNY